MCDIAALTVIVITIMKFVKSMGWVHDMLLSASHFSGNYTNACTLRSYTPEPLQPWHRVMLLVFFLST